MSETGAILSHYRKFLSLTMNYDWRRLFVGTVHAIFCHWPWTMTGRGDLSVLSLQIFVIDYGTMTGIGYLSVLSLQIFVVGEHCPYLQWRHLTVNHGTMTGRGYLWVLSLQIFVIDHELWLEEVICRYCPCKFLSLVGTVPTNSGII